MENLKKEENNEKEEGIKVEAVLLKQEEKWINQ